jgi:hypothetical protein
MAEITKRRVTMRSVTAVPVSDLFPEGLATTEVSDYVRPDFLDEYVADARTRWQDVQVSDEPDAGPLGFDGPTFIPAHLEVPNAGTYFPATPGSKVEAALIKAGDPMALAAKED